MTPRSTDDQLRAADAMVGKAIRAFSELEVELHLCLREFLPLESYEHLAKKRHLSIPILTSVVYAMVSIDVAKLEPVDREQLETDLRACLDEIESLSKTRNKLAHSPVSIWQNSGLFPRSRYDGVGIFRSANGKELQLDLTSIETFALATVEARRKLQVVMSHISRSREE